MRAGNGRLTPKQQLSTRIRLITNWFGTIKLLNEIESLAPLKPTTMTISIDALYMSDTVMKY